MVERMEESKICSDLAMRQVDDDWVNYEETKPDIII